MANRCANSSDSRRLRARNRRQLLPVPSAIAISEFNACTGHCVTMAGCNTPRPPVPRSIPCAEFQVLMQDSEMVKMVEKTKRMIQAVFLGLLIPACVLGQTPAVEMQSSGEWTASSGQALRSMALSSVDQELGMVNRNLYLWKGVDGAILDVKMDVEASRLSMRWTDDESGWWIELEQDYESRWASLKDGFRKIDGSGVGDEEERYEIVLRAKGQHWLSGNLAQESTHRGTLTWVDQSDISSELARTIPQATREILCLLRDVGERQTSERFDMEEMTLAPSWALTQILHHVLASAAEDPCSTLAPWSFTGAQQGPVSSPSAAALQEPDLIAMVSSFSALENVDPMKGFRPQDLFRGRKD